MPAAEHSVLNGPPPRGHARAEVIGSGAVILDAVVDRRGGHWIRYGTTNRSVWFSLQELQQDPRRVFARLSGPGMTYLTPSSQNQFKTLIENCAAYRAGLVAAHQGWVGSHYVFGDGEVLSPPDTTEQVIVAFEPDEKFAERGSLEGWASAVHPLVGGQRLPLFVLAYAFIGPLMRFAPPDMLNPVIELVGESGTGKSTLGVLASSVWGGQPGSDVGSGQSWALTLASLDNVKRRYSDSHLTLDEGGLIGSSRKEQRELIERAVFMLASSEEKRRYGDTGARDHVRLATLSTTNVPLAELISAPDPVRDALSQRMITIRVVGEHGVLDHIPDGHNFAGNVIEALRGAVDAHYGVAARVFVQRVATWVAAPGNNLQASIRKRMEYYCLNAASPVSHTPARVTKIFAMTFAAGTLAQKCGLIPGTPKELLDAIRSIHAAVVSAPPSTRRPDALQQITEYARSNWDVLIAADQLEKPLPPSEFEGAEGFWRAAVDGTEILIPSPRFQQAFSDPRGLMTALAQLGAARTERGKNPKMTIKTPHGICRTGRVYCICLPEKASDLSNSPRTA